MWATDCACVHNRTCGYPTRWHPEYCTTGSTLGSSPKPRSGVNVNTTSFLSPIPENTSTLYHHHSHPDLEVHSFGARRSDYSLFPDVSLEDDELFRRVHSDNELHAGDAGHFVKRGRKDWRGRDVSGEHYHSMDYSPSQSSEGYGSSPNLHQPVPGIRISRAVCRRGSMSESTTDSESSELRSFSGRNIDGGMSFSAGPQRPYFHPADLWRPGCSDSDMRRRSYENGLSLERQPPRSRSRFERQQLSRSCNSHVVPSHRQGGCERRHPASSSSNRQSGSSSLNHSRSEAGRGCQPGSRRQSIFSLGSSAVSAEMVSNNPSAAASVAFASLELPSNLAMTPTKQIRHLCGPVVTCLLVVTLAASLAAAIYFAVVLSKKQTAEVEFLRATLNFHLDQASATTLDSMSTSQRSSFEAGIAESDLYRNSSLSDTYKGCEVTSAEENGLNVMLYFDLPPSHQASNSDVILHVLSSSAPRLKAEQGDVISINNLPVKMSRVTISVDQTTKLPKFAPVAFDSTSDASDDEDVDVTVHTSPLRSATGAKDDSLHQPCSQRESGTFYRYPGSCTRFIQCLRGRPILLSCGSDLVFDIHRKECVAEVTDCDAEAEKAEELNDVDPEALEPCEYKGGNYHPHPYACNLYIQCSFGDSSVLKCPDGLVFNSQIQTCVLLDKNFQCPQPPTNQNAED